MRNDRLNATIVRGIGPLARQQVSVQPGQLSTYEPPEKPADGSTPYRSASYVSMRKSADGNSYSPGQTIPEAEAVRQGLVNPERIPQTELNVRIPATGTPHARDRDAGSHVCPNCEGRRVAMKGHGPDRHHKKGCPGCKPCGTCKGSGYLLQEETA